MNIFYKFKYFCSYTLHLLCFSTSLHNQIRGKRCLEKLYCRKAVNSTLNAFNWHRCCGFESLEKYHEARLCVVDKSRFLWWRQPIF